MIIDKTIRVKNKPYYIKIGYNSGIEFIDVKIDDIRHCSHVKIKVRCDYCGNEKELSFVKYMKNTKYNKLPYACSHKCSVEKLMNTFNDKFGCVSSQHPDIKQKMRETNLEKYGVEYTFQSNEIMEKSKQSNLKKFGVDNASQSDIIKQKKIETTLKNWGVENPSQSTEIKNKKIITHKKHFGVEYGTQSREIYIQRMKKQNKIHKYNDTDLLYQGSYEKDFLDNYYNKFKINNFKDKIQFLYENNNRIYIPDFYISDLNLIVEIKSSYWFNKFKHKNIVKEERCKDLGYNFIFIINKNYIEFDHMVRVLSIQ